MGLPEILTVALQKSVDKSALEGSVDPDFMGPCCKPSNRAGSCPCGGVWGSLFGCGLVRSRYDFETQIGQCKTPVGVSRTW